MIFTVVWEDSTGMKRTGFGPHLLLVACVEDEMARLSTPRARTEIDAVVDSIPKNGNSKVLSEMKARAAKLLNRGPVWAVIDRDKADRLWSAEARPPNCIRGICDALYRDAPGDYEWLLLVDNVESLVDACCAARGVPLPVRKPSPDERDRLMAAVAWAPDKGQRERVRQTVPSFERLVQHVASKLAELLQAPP